MIIAKLQSWALTALAVLAVLVGAYAMGGRAARRSVQVDQARRDVKDMGEAREARAEIDSLDDDAVRDRARQRMRNRAK